MSKTSLSSRRRTEKLYAEMLRRILHIPAESMLPQLDATDGLAAALCHYYETSRPIASHNRSSNWKDFIAKNPDKVVQRAVPRHNTLTDEKEE